MSDAIARPVHSLRVVSASRARAEGCTRSTVARLVRSGRWHQICHGVYLVGWPGPRPRWRELPVVTRVEAALALHGPDAVVSHRSAAWLHQLPEPPGTDATVHLTLPPGRERHQLPGMALHLRRLRADDVTTLTANASLAPEPMPCTTLEQTLADVLRTWGDWAAVSALDHALCQRLVDDSAPSVLEPRLWRQRGATDARRRLRLGDGRAQSPLETRIRLIAVAARIPPDELQLPVHDASGHLLGYGDLAWHRPDGRTLVVEADGRRWHEAPEAVLHDRRRANGFVGTGRIDMVRFVWDDTRRPSYVEGVLREHLSRR